MRSIRILRLLTILPAVFEAAVSARAAETLPPSKPNIVFIFADDWGWGDLSCHGNTWLKTPHLDQLAGDGIDFRQFNVLNPVCSPSRTAATTGVFPARFCIHQHFAPHSNVKRGMPDWLDPKAPTLARFLKNAGYRTGHFGKWHLTDEVCKDAPTPAAYGFDESALFIETGPMAGFHDTATNAVRFIRENKSRPFYLNVWIHESHLPHQPCRESLEKWKNLDDQKRVYAAVITDGDNKVGAVLDALKETGVADNTIAIFSSDNGPEWTRGKRQQIDVNAIYNPRRSGYGGYYSVGETGGLRGRKRSLFKGGGAHAIHRALAWSCACRIEKREDCSLGSGFAAHAVRRRRREAA
jgi:arylsulfatase A-like enzyme